MAARAATLTRLLRWLQLYVLADPSVMADGLLEQIAAVVGGLQAPDTHAVGAKRPNDGQQAGAVTKRARVDQPATASADNDDEAGDAWEDQLVDVVLALLSYGGQAAEGSLSGLPSAPLRDAVERVFKAHCRVLTAEGLRDLLRVIGQVRCC